MSVLLAKIKFQTLNGTFFTQYYEVNTDQLQELATLNFLQSKHTCRHRLADLIKHYNIDDNIKLNASCLFCKCNLRELQHIDYVETNTNILSTESSFTLDMLLQIIKEEKELSFYQIEIDEKIKLRELEIIKERQLEQEMRLKEYEDEQRYTYVTSCNKLRQNGYAMIQGHPCKIVAMTTSKD